MDMLIVMLLRRHIEKEDTVVYPFAKKHLSEEIFAEMIKENQIIKYNISESSYFL